MGRSRPRVADLQRPTTVHDRLIDDAFLRFARSMSALEARSRAIPRAFVRVGHWARMREINRRGERGIRQARKWRSDGGGE